MVRFAARAMTPPSRTITAPTGTSPAAALSAAAASASYIHASSLDGPVNGQSTSGDDRLLLRRLRLREGDLAVGPLGGENRIALVEFAAEQRHREWVLNHPLDR